MKRRNFLKLVAAVVVCPNGLLTEKKKPWATFHTNGGDLTDREREELIKKMRRAFKNTKFKKPIRPIIYYRGVRIHYIEDLYG